MPKDMQVLTFRWDSDFVEAVRLSAGPRGMSGYVRGLIETDLGWPSGKAVKQDRVEPTVVKAQSLARASASVIGHPFVPQRNSPFRCEACGMNQGAHTKEA